MDPVRGDVGESSFKRDAVSAGVTTGLGAGVGAGVGSRFDMARGSKKPLGLATGALGGGLAAFGGEAALEPLKPKAREAWKRAVERQRQTRARAKEWYDDRRKDA